MQLGPRDPGSLYGAQANFVVRMETPSNVTALSSASALSVTTGSTPGRNVTEFAMSPVMATDYLALAAGFVHKRSRTTATGVNVTAYSAPSVQDQVNFSLRVRPGPPITGP